MPNLYEALQAACGRCQADLLALSGGLDSSIIAYMLRGRGLGGIAVISEDFVSMDLTYCQLAASRLGVRLCMIRPSIPDLLAAADETVRILGNFNDIEVRNSAVMYLAIKAAKEKGAASIITGDGADELFAGYDFMLKIEPRRLGGELGRMRQIMHFTSQEIGRELGVAIESPFLDGAVLQAASEIPPGTMVGTYNGKRMGKIPLRRLFEGKIPRAVLRRAKTPMQDGAGTAGLSGLADLVISNEAFAAKRDSILSGDGVRIRTKESLLYYQAYRRHYEPPARVSGGCPHCGHAIRENSRFCRMCGAYPVARQGQSC